MFSDVLEQYDNTKTTGVYEASYNTFYTREEILRDVSKFHKLGYNEMNRFVRENPKYADIILSTTTGSILEEEPNKVIVDNIDSIEKKLEAIQEKIAKLDNKADK